MTRNERQRAAFAWAEKCFGKSETTNLEQRAIRLLEEAVEAAQAVGVPESLASFVVKHVYSKPVGDLRQELGGVGLTLLVLAHAANIDADYCEEHELVRVTSKPIEHFAQRNIQKNEAALKATVRSCNRHSNCEKAAHDWLLDHPGKKCFDIPANFHCYDDECEDCFGC